METSLKSLKAYYAYIHNLFEANYTTGRIKVIKHIVFGYRGFHYFNARIMIIQNYTLTYKKQNNQASSSLT